MFESIFGGGTLAATSFFIALGVALACGIIYAFLSCYKSASSFGFFVATSLLPMTVAAVIALVNGSLGVGVAIAGAFGLVRFRSAPGSAREIVIVFVAMASGLAFGTGYLAYGCIFLLFCGALLFLFGLVETKRKSLRGLEKNVKITIPESLDYTSVFDDVFCKYATSFSLEKVKSANMGSMFKLSYRITLKNAESEKPMLDEIRTRNGNLEIMCSRADVEENEL